MCFYKHIIWGITVQHILMANASKGPLLNIRYYYCYFLAPPEAKKSHNAAVSQIY